MGNPKQTHHGCGPLGSGVTYPHDGRQQCFVSNRARSDAVSGTLRDLEAQRHGDRVIRAPETTRHLRVAFGWAHGVPAVFEYAPERHWFWGENLEKPFTRKRQLTYKPAKPRQWYTVGDLVLYESLDEYRLIKRYKELAPPPGEQEPALSTLVLGLLMGPPEDYNIAHKITRIEPRGNGQGHVELTPIVFLDDRTFIELEDKIRRSQLELNEMWLWYRIAANFFAVMTPMATAYYEVLWSLGTGGAGLALRGGGRRVALLTLRQAMRHTVTRRLARKVVVKLGKDTTKATLAASTAFAKAFAKSYYVETKKQNFAGRSPGGGQVDRQAFDASLKRAAGEAASAFLGTLLGLPMDRRIGTSGYGELQAEIAKRIVSAFGTQIPGGFAKAIAHAWAAEDQKPGSFSNELVKGLLAELRSSFASLVKVDFKRVAESLATD
jgi:hypothetical protein